MNRLQDTAKIFIVVSMLTTLLMLFIFIKPFLPVVVISSVVVVAFYPIHKFFTAKIKNKNFSSALSTFIVLSIVLLPITFFVFYLSQQAVNTYEFLESKINEIDFKLLPSMLSSTFIGKFVDDISLVFPIKTQDIVSLISSSAQNFSQYLVNKTTGIAKQLSIVLFQLFMFVLSLFFLFRDGNYFVNQMKSLLPMAKRYREEMFEKLSKMSKGILYGVFGASIIQGFLGGIGFAIASIENAVFWGTVIGIFSIIPYIGSTVIWIPAAIILFFNGHAVAGVFLIIWCSVLVGTVDNFIKPIIIGEKAHIHPLLTFLSIIGGFFVMGLSGLVIAPYVLSLALTFVHIYKLEYKELLE